MFYLKLAWNNLRNSAKFFAPFVLSTLVLFILVCSTFLISLSPVSDSMQLGKITLGLAIIVLTIFSTIMSIYSYNFLLKQRSREFGLYNVLGMNKSQVSLIATIELSIIFIITVIIGSVLSSVFSNVLYLIFVNLMNYGKLSFTIMPLAFILTGIIFAAIFFLLELIGLRKIGATSPLILFRSQEQSEKEPKGNVILAFVGIIALGVGYYLSLSSSKIAALVVLLRFFVAVVFVIIGTYLFYISFTTWYLKKRRQNKTYFYQPNHFITTSQMIFRMKQNAVGLANITLLAIMAFVTIATTASLYSGSNELAKQTFPKNTRIDFQVQDRSQGEQAIQEIIENSLGQPKTDVNSYLSVLMQLNLPKRQKWTITEQAIQNPNPTSTGYNYVITQEDFRKLGNKLQHLEDNQTALFVQKGDSKVTHIDFLGKTFENVKNFKSVKMPDSINTYNSSVLIVSNDEVMREMVGLYQSVSKNQFKMTYLYSTFVNLNDKESAALKQLINDYSDKNQISGYYQTKKNLEQELMAMSGGFLFTGFLLGISFLLGAALIIYYKQYSEGNEDKKSYKILQEVGMSKASVRKTINSQTIFVFFMPLLMAVLHFVVALTMIKQMLLLFGVTSTNLIYTVSGVTIIGITLIYFFIYRLTSRTYYKIIER